MKPSFVRPPAGGSWTFDAIGVVACIVLVALGVWQLERREWKLALIERIEQRIHAAPVAAPGRDAWPQVNRADHEYRRVRVAGRYLHDRETRVQAVTALGSGWWVMTPLAVADDSVVLVNRGFVAAGTASRAVSLPPGTSGDVVVTGLLRISEPGGAFLRRNDAAAGRWTSRDVHAIAAARALPMVAPYFIDADATSDGTADATAPIGGMTRVSFANNHAVYALTWFTLGAMVAGGLVYRRRLEQALVLRDPAV